MITSAFFLSALGIIHGLGYFPEFFKLEPIVYGQAVLILAIWASCLMLLLTPRQQTSVDSNTKTEPPERF